MSAGPQPMSKHRAKNPQQKTRDLFAVRGPAPGEIVGGRWRVSEAKGPTERGAAFRAESLADGQVARLEIWDRRHVERRGELAQIEREARILGRLRNPRCLSLLDFGVH